LLYVQEPYPAMRTAQRVMRRSETILTPIEAAAEDVEVRTERMNEMLDSPSVGQKPDGAVGRFCGHAGARRCQRDLYGVPQKGPQRSGRRRGRCAAARRLCRGR